MKAEIEGTILYNCGYGLKQKARQYQGRYNAIIINDLLEEHESSKVKMIPKLNPGHADCHAKIHQGDLKGDSDDFVDVKTLS